MITWNNIENFKRLNSAIVTTGFFDGVHLGHRKILNRLISEAKKNGSESAVVTFWPHPKKVLVPGFQLQILTTLEEKIKLMEEMKIDHFIILPFNKEFSEISSHDFLKNFLEEKIGTKTLLIGHDHRFGKNREGNFEYIKKNSSRFGFRVIEIPREEIDETGVSSTAIRDALAKGDISTATRFLGRHYSFEGKVVEGKKLGRELGFPTANLEIENPEKLLPKDGIYAVKAEYDCHQYHGMMSIGFNPTIEGKSKTIEVNIFDFNENIYGKTLKVYPIEYLREEKKFESLEELKKQIEKDKEQTLAIFSTE